MTDNQTGDVALQKSVFRLMLKWRDDFKEAAAIYKLSATIFTELDQRPEVAQLCLELQTQAEANMEKVEKIIIGFSAPKS